MYSKVFACVFTQDVLETVEQDVLETVCKEEPQEARGSFEKQDVLETDYVEVHVPASSGPSTFGDLGKIYHHFVWVAPILTGTSLDMKVPYFV